MPLLHIVVLALVQGITEFLPISSSGHLVLVWAALGEPHQTESQRLALDIAAHVGTLFAVCAYYWREMIEMAKGTLGLARGRRDDGGNLVLFLIVGTIPVGLLGLVFKDEIAHYLHGERAVEIVAWATIVFGILLFAADRATLTVKRLSDMTLGKAFFIGLFQAVALIPGTSRSGITMTAARFLGFERAEAARFSLLLAIPTIAASGLLVGIDIYRSGNLALGLDALIAAVLSFFFALIAIVFMIRWLRRASFTPFVIYRLLLGAVLLGWVYLGPG